MPKFSFFFTPMFYRPGTRGYVRLVLGLALMVTSRGWCESSVTEEPSHCLTEKVQPCFVATKYRPVLLTLEGDVHLWLSAESSVELSSHKLKLLAGDILYRSQEDYAFETGLVSGIGSGSVWLSQTGGVTEARTLIRNLAGDVIVRGKLDHVESPLPLGFENWYSLRNGPSGVARPIAVTESRGRFLALFGSLSEGLAKDWGAWSKSWEQSTVLASERYSAMVHRSLASAQERTENLRQKREVAEQEKHFLRQMYRQKNGLGPHPEEGESPEPGSDAN